AARDDGEGRKEQQGRVANREFLQARAGPKRLFEPHAELVLGTADGQPDIAVAAAEHIDDSEHTDDSREYNVAHYEAEVPQIAQLVLPRAVFEPRHATAADVPPQRHDERHDEREFNAAEVADFDEVTRVAEQRRDEQT